MTALETKNRNVRFHAIQSIIVFGFLSVAGGFLQQITYAGWLFGVVLAIITLSLWIVLMVKAYNGELYRLPPAGDLAARIAGIPPDESGETSSSPPGNNQPEAVVPPPATNVANAKVKGRIGRITTSGLTIAWSIIWLILLNKFSQYIAYYQMDAADGVTRWLGYPLLTNEFALWLPTINTVLILAIIGHIILIMFENL